MADYTLKFIRKYRNISQNEGIVIHYGASLIYLNITKIFILYFAAYLLGIVPYFILINLGFSLLRMFAYGVHAKTSTGCTASVLVSFTAIYIIAEYLYVPWFVYYAVLPFVSLGLIVKYAPGATAKNPIKDKSLCHKLKLKSSFVFLMIYFCALYLSFRNPLYGKLLLLGAVWESITLAPMLFRLIEKGEETYEKNFI